MTIGQSGAAGTPRAYPVGSAPSARTTPTESEDCESGSTPSKSWTSSSRDSVSCSNSADATRSSATLCCESSLTASVYAISGLLAGVGGVLLTSRLGAGIPTAGTGFELQAIAACVIGGASLSGARGSAIGAACGAVIIGVLNNGGNLLAVNSFYLQIAIGVLILVAVGFDQMNTRNAARGG